MEGTPMERILDQAMKGLKEKEIPGVFPGLYGLTLAELRFGNIIAIAGESIGKPTGHNSLHLPRRVTIGQEDLASGV